MAGPEDITSQGALGRREETSLLLLPR
jgi:hypothetical protein